MFAPVERTKNGVRLVDQRKLPLVETYLECTTPEQVADAIRDMVVRGAPAIGISAAFGLALGATQAIDLSEAAFDKRLEQLDRLLGGARPTAVRSSGWLGSRGPTHRPGRALESSGRLRDAGGLGRRLRLPPRARARRLGAPFLLAPPRIASSSPGRTRPAD